MSTLFDHWNDYSCRPSYSIKGSVPNRKNIREKYEWFNITEKTVLIRISIMKTAYHPLLT